MNHATPPYTPEVQMIDEMVRNRPRSGGEALEAFIASWKELPAGQVAAYNAWKREQNLGSPAVERAARVGYAAMREAVPAENVLTYDDLSFDRKRQLAEWVLAAKTLVYTDGLCWGLAYLKDSDGKAIPSLFACTVAGLDL